MKTAIFLLTLVMPSIGFAQDTSRAALLRQVEERRATVAEAAETFLNRRLSAERRLAAIAPYPVLFDEKQIARVISVVADAQEPPEIRAAALDRVVEYVPNDERLVRLVNEWLGNPRETPVLRRAALRTDSTLAFEHMHITDVHRKMLDDPDPEFRVYAFSRLVPNGDARAQQKLIAGLENPESASVPAPVAITILSTAPKIEAFPALLNVVQRTGDEAARLEAIRVLGSYEPARKTLVAISRSASEKTEARAAALGALYAADRDNIVQYALPIVSAADVSPDLQTLAIQMTTNVRQAMTYRFNAKRADSYDRLIARLAREGAPQVRKAATAYLESVRPRY